jgi:ribA/ribD-fused uncharacterized protein
MISNFSGKNEFLSNFCICPVWIDFKGRKWATTEQAYQAAKLKDEDMETMNLMDQDKITPGKSKRMGQKIDIRSDWNAIKIIVMTKINEEKFSKNPELMGMLQATKGQELIEGNDWNDTFWGQCPIGNGRNELGKVLMGIRDSII